MAIEVIIGNMTFPTKDAATAHFRAILYRDVLDTVVEGDDAKSVQALLHARPEKVAELEGRTVVRYLRKMHRHNTPCFFAELNDGTLMDVSFRKFIDAYRHPTTVGSP